MVFTPAVLELQTVSLSKSTPLDPKSNAKTDEPEIGMAGIEGTVPSFGKVDDWNKRMYCNAGLVFIITNVSNFIGCVDIILEATNVPPLDVANGSGISLVGLPVILTFRHGLGHAL